MAALDLTYKVPVFTCFLTFRLGVNSTEVCTNVTVLTKASEAQLSQEECGIKLIIMDDKRDLELDSSSG